jgi:16S rRNA (guanine966-N2)-methyltransferase
MRAGPSSENRMLTHGGSVAHSVQPQEGYVRITVHMLQGSMRVIAGEFRSRRLKTLDGMALRPTPDRLREALFNVLGARVEGVTFLDAYAGSGSVGIEALSRGAAHAIFIEKHFSAARVIRENLASLGLEDRATVVQKGVVAALPRFEADMYFLDPPYAEASEYETALSLLGERPALVLAQHSKRFELAAAYGKLRRTRVLTHGDNAISFFVVS